MVPAGDEAANFPSHASVHLDHESDGTVGLVLRQGGAVVRSHRDVGAVNKGRPNVGVFVALVDGLDGGEVGDLLAVIDGVGVEIVVVDADFAIRVTGGNGDLKVGGEEDRGGHVEGVDGGVLEGEPWFLGLEDGPCDEESKEDDEGEDEESGA